jgi:glycosyltransferase involved in cell wall biosynthesis
MPEVSVIIPLLNKGSCIKRAIDSVFVQKYQDFEIIVVDGGSTDGSLEIMREIRDPRLTLVTQPTKGVSEARNFGVELSQGSLIVFLDADDEWLPGHINTCLRLREKFPEAGAFTTAYKICNKNGNMRWPKYRAIPAPPWEGLLPNYFSSAVHGEFPVWTSAVCIPKKIFRELGGFPTGSWWGEDADLWGRIALRYPIAFTWETGAIYHWDVSGRACCRPSLDEEPFVRTGRKAIAENRVPSDILPDLTEYLNKKEIYRAACHLFVNNTCSARDILRNTKTRVFVVQKIALYCISYFPSFLAKKILSAFFFKE